MLRPIRGVYTHTRSKKGRVGATAALVAASQTQKAAMINYFARILGFDRLETLAFNSVYRIVIILCGVLASPATAEVKLPAIFGSNMVLQQGTAVVVWGWGDVGEDVSVSIAGQKATTTADKDGRWAVTLKPIAATGVGKPQTMLVEGRNRIKFDNVLVGEVWLCSGQSNMEYTIAKVEKADSNGGNKAKDDDGYDQPNIRLFKVAQVASPTPLDDLNGEWVECNKRNVSEFSAVGYYFGRELQHRRSVPVGLIQSCWWGTPAQPWTPLEALEADEMFRPGVENWRKSMAAFPAAQARYEQQLTAYKERQSKTGADVAGGGEPPKPPTDPGRVKWMPSVNYNGMINPLVRFRLAGVVWYQGEGNVTSAYQYRKLLPILIRAWRAKAGQEFPFLIVQLHNIGLRQTEPGDSSWAELREAQAMSLSLPKTGMAVTIDLGADAGYADPQHPPNKIDVGLRLSQVAFNLVYSLDGFPSSPMYEAMKIEGSTVRISFRHAGGGLVTTGDRTVLGFAIAGEDRKFVWADAIIDGDLIAVHSDAVEKPVAVRYAWADNPKCNVYNKEGLPLCPFRTDDWPGMTWPNKPR